MKLMRCILKLMKCMPSMSDYRMNITNLYMTWRAVNIKIVNSYAPLVSFFNKPWSIYLYSR